MGIDWKEPFWGIVHIKDSLPLPDGRYIWSIAGKISVHVDEETFGFKARGGDSNWFLRVEGPSGQFAVILGCQVRAVSSLPIGKGEWPSPASTVWEL
jgi:hypothetical protein